MSTSTTAPATQESDAGRGTKARAFLRDAAPSLIVDAALPYAVYVLLSGQGMSDVAALAWSALPPALNVGYQALRARRLNPVGALVLLTIVVGIATSLLSGDARFAVARDALTSIVFGLLLGGSLLARRPLVHHVMRTFGRFRRPDLPEVLERMWATNPAYRRAVRRATVVGALAMTFEAALRVTLAYTLPVAVALPLLTAQSVLVWVALSALLVVTIKRACRA